MERYLSRSPKICHPNRQGGWDGEAITKGGNRDDKDVYDSTAIVATKTFVSNTMLALTPTASRWVHLEALEGKTKTKEIDEINKEYIKYCKKVIFTKLQVLLTQI